MKLFCSTGDIAGCGKAFSESYLPRHFLRDYKTSSSLCSSDDVSFPRRRWIYPRLACNQRRGSHRELQWSKAQVNYLDDVDASLRHRLTDRCYARHRIAGLQRQA
jgi:hypothetical protein